MKRIMLIILFTLILSGCGSSEPVTTDESVKVKNPFSLEGFGDVSEFGGLNVIKDTETGCEYILFESNYKAAMSPRLDKNGKQVCR